MSIAEDLNLKLKNNRHIMYITDADDLLAAWCHRREKTSRCRCFDFFRVPQEYRLSAPPNEDTQLMPCHVSMRRKSSHVDKTIKPAPEYSTMACHGHGRKKSISLDNLDALYAASFAKRNIAPYVSPIFDTATLTLVCKDLGITGEAIPKVIKGRQYIAFTGYAGLRTRFPGTIYLANNRKIIKMAIGSLGIKNMVKNGGMLTICITVPLTVLECFLRDPYSLSAFAGNLASDFMKIGIAAIIGAIFGIAIGGVVTIAAVPIAHMVAIAEDFFPLFIKKHMKIFNFSAIITLVIFIFVGLCISSWIKSKVENTGYIYCRNASGVSALAKTLVYTKNMDICEELVASKQKR